MKTEVRSVLNYYGICILFGYQHKLIAQQFFPSLRLLQMDPVGRLKSCIISMAYKQV